MEDSAEGYAITALQTFVDRHAHEHALGEAALRVEATAHAMLVYWVTEAAHVLPTRF